MSNLKCQQLSSFTDISFWTTLLQKKIDDYKLDDSPKQILGGYTFPDKNTRSSMVHLKELSFIENPDDLPRYYYPYHGTLYNVNTLNDFKKLNKLILASSAGKQLWDDIVQRKVLQNPELLNRFILLSFADIKTHNNIYWFAFPTLILKNMEIKTSHTLLTIQNQKILMDSFKKFTEYHVDPYFIVKDFKCFRLSTYDTFKDDDLSFGFVDMCHLNTNPGWNIRNFLIFIAYTFKKTTFKVYSLRGFNYESVCFHIDMKYDKISFDNMKTIGWEKNGKNHLGPRMIQLKDIVDPETLAENACDLNVKLMKWRMMPKLDIDKIQRSKCLLLGAGTLGCCVSRLLVGWGVKNITFVDHGTISYSNPSRQSLYTFEDNGGAKAEFAADAIKKINPNIIVKGVNISIGMPGHQVHSTEIDDNRESYEKLDKLYDEHDYIFLLTDNRESRWLPTLLGKVKNKIVINIALGFDYFVVQYQDTGCYFCNDMLAPSNSLRNRTLDQMCSVTRPGIAYMASAIAVELFINKMDPDKLNEPNQIRGTLDNYNIVKSNNIPFDRCTACSSKVINKYNEEKYDLIYRVQNNSNHLEYLSGIDTLIADDKINDIIVF
jgi:ubiquitin-like modifier-activating enzyme ATG7